jgi:xanthosine utilization system XapX-like protein
MAAGQSSARAAVLRSALLFTPFFALALLGFVFIARDAQQGLSAGRVVGLALMGLVVLLLGYQVVQSVRDLFSGLVETAGLVERQWSRNEFFLFRNTYIFVGKDVYRLSPEQGIQVERGNMVRIVHLPHTSTVETIEVVRQESGAPAG